MQPLGGNEGRRGKDSSWGMLQGARSKSSACSRNATRAAL